MAEMALTWNGDAVLARMRAAQIEGVNKTMAECVAHAKANHEWMNQTSNLTRSIQITTFAHPVERGVSGHWGSTDVAYALIHEIGGTIVPKKAKFLAVPVSPAAKRAGSPRNMRNLVYVQSIKGQPMLVEGTAQARGRKLGKLKVHFILRKRVTIKARPYLRPAADLKYPGLAKNIAKAWEKYKPGAATPPPEGGADA